MLNYFMPVVSRLINQATQQSKFSTSLWLPDKKSDSSQEPPTHGGDSTRFLEDMFNAWKNDPRSVHPSWDLYFRKAISGLSGSSMSPRKATIYSAAPVSTVPGSSGGGGGGDTQRSLEEYLNLYHIIRNYQIRGHRVARVNPLEEMFDIDDKTSSLTEKLGKPPKEVIRYHKLDSSMFTQMYRLPPFTNIGGGENQLPLKEIIKRLELSYCRHIGVEFMHMSDHVRRDWLRDRFEIPGAMELSKEDKKMTLFRLGEAVLFEEFCIKKWSSEKKFGLEGLESMIPCMKSLIDTLSKNGVEVGVMGMAHRGRLNVLANVCEKSMKDIFLHFRGLKPEDEGSGDVKYHLGVYNKIKSPVTNKEFLAILVANPSHLECVNAVCTGRAKAEMFYRNDPNGDKVATILMHGDAAIAGQGVIYECINLAKLAGYHTGGVIHIVSNNQVGFTTDPHDSRSGVYCSDVAKVIEAPVFHVNADDPESVVYVAKVAADFRCKFHSDVFIDLIGYRRFGHNEQDEPRFTQPLMYKIIDKMPTIFEKYAASAIKQGIITDDEKKAFVSKWQKHMEDEFQKASTLTTLRLADWIDSPWHGFFKNKDPFKCEPTGAPKDVLEHIAKKYSTPPPGFTLHKVIQKILNTRADYLKNGIVDWSMGEALAFGTLMKEGVHVRISGQDAERATFAFRHHVVHDQNTGKKFQYLTDLYPDQAKYTVINSPLTEYAVMGFEHGYSMARPNCLVFWEAQFADFSNNAQTIIDCFICSGESKWVRQCGLVLLLPHGFEGMGPEHSSGRLERLLLLASDDEDQVPPSSPDFAMKQLKAINWIVANCTTPANYFHLLRRQIKMPFRKPLIIATPKSLLRRPENRSKIDDLVIGKEFLRLIPESGVASNNPSNVKRLIFCSGKVYLDFFSVIKEKNLLDKIAIARVEQVCPFPYDLVQKEAEKYSSAEIAWGQEEHKNEGCWPYVQSRLKNLFKGKNIKYIGRDPSAATAPGNNVIYKTEFNKLMNDVVKGV